MMKTDQLSAQETEKPERLYQPTARECALLVLALIQAKVEESGRPMTRARFTEATLRKLWVRSRIADDLLRAVQEILLHGGWALFWAGASFAVIKLDVVEGWGRISWKRLDADLKDVKRGKYQNFSELEKLLLGDDDDDAESEDEFDESGKRD
jgi:hypothetical protein